MEGYQEIDTGMAAGLMVGYFIVMIVLYVFYAYCVMKIAEKTNTENGWFAFIPILNVILMLQIAGKPLWWIILLLIPLVNIIILIIVWMAIAEKRGKPSWWGILLIVPFANLIVIPYLAFSD